MRCFHCTCVKRIEFSRLKQNIGKFTFFRLLSRNLILLQKFSVNLFPFPLCSIRPPFAKPICLATVHNHQKNLFVFAFQGCEALPAYWQFVLGMLGSKLSNFSGCKKRVWTQFLRVLKKYILLNTFNLCPYILMKVDPLKMGPAQFFLTAQD